MVHWCKVQLHLLTGYCSILLFQIWPRWSLGFQRQREATALIRPLQCSSLNVNVLRSQTWHNWDGQNQGNRGSGRRCGIGIACRVWSILVSQFSIIMKTHSSHDGHYQDNLVEFPSQCSKISVAWRVISKAEIAASAQNWINTENPRLNFWGSRKLCKNSHNNIHPRWLQSSLA